MVIAVATTDRYHCDLALVVIVIVNVIAIIIADGSKYREIDFVFLL